MGSIIRPPEFTPAPECVQVKAPADLARMRRPIRALPAARFDIRLAAIVMAVMAMAWMLALAGAAFAVRAMLVVCFATLAGSARRYGVPIRPTVRIDRRNVR